MAIMVKGKLKKWGNSFGVIIPKEIVDSNKFKAGQEIECMIIEDSKKRFDELFGSLKGKFKKSTEEMMREMDKELYPEDHD